MILCLSILEFSKTEFFSINYNSNSIYSFWIFAALDHITSLNGIAGWLAIFHLLCFTAFVYNLLYQRELVHWPMRHCFVEILGEAPTAPIFRRFDPLLQVSAHWNKRQNACELAIQQVGLAMLRLSILYFSQSFCDIVSTLSLNSQIP